MTVEQLLQRLVELARDGLGQHTVKLYQPDRVFDDYEDVGEIYVAGNLQEVVIDYDPKSK